ncbi:MAG: GGDEF domain-containing protein [Acidobacteria bacterium]|nr:GGDEF domain-containing protein [Acidobacteriota bacterium]
MSEFRCIEPDQLERFVHRRTLNLSDPGTLNLADNLVEVLRKANEFVPSGGGSILLDRPHNPTARQAPALTFIAAFGERADELLATTIDSPNAVASRVYASGKSERLRLDAEVAAAAHYGNRSLVAIPIRIGDEVCGVLELIDRQEANAFSHEDVNLQEIFADYISIAIRNVLEGRLAQEIAQKDNLTGLLNDRSLHLVVSRVVDECRESASDLSLLFLDLDYFKHVNDSHGHLVGSQVLREVGQLLGKRCEAAKVIAARYGGDEFVLAAPGKSLEVAIDLAEELREAIASGVYCTRPSEIQPETLELTGITCSIGIASLHRHTTPDLSPERCKISLLRLADAAMYVAKETGRNRTAVAGELVRRRHFDPADIGFPD